MSAEGTIYLIHFHKPFKHARHYIGWTTDLEGRIEAHKAGQGARLLAVLRQHGITWTVAKTWPGQLEMEKRMKGRGKSALCPICSAYHGTPLREPMSKQQLKERGRYQDPFKKPTKPSAPPAPSEPLAAAAGGDDEPF